MPLSLFCSIVSILPRRTDTDRPLPSLISTAASVAPCSLAKASTSLRELLELILGVGEDGFVHVVFSSAEPLKRVS